MAVWRPSSGSRKPRKLVYATLLLSGGLIRDMYVRGHAFAIGPAVAASAELVSSFGPRLGPQGPAAGAVRF